MPNTNKDDAKGYRVKKERLTGLLSGISRVEDVEETSPLIPSRVVVDPRQQAICDEFAANCESTTPPRRKPRELLPFNGGGPHWNTPVQGTRKRNKPELFCPPVASPPVAAAAVAGAVNIDDYQDNEGEVIIQHEDVGERLAYHDDEGMLQFGTIESVAAWGSNILIRNLKFDDEDCGVDQLNPEDLKKYRAVYQQV